MTQFLIKLIFCLFGIYLPTFNDYNLLINWVNTDNKIYLIKWLHFMYVLWYFYWFLFTGDARYQFKGKLKEHIEAVHLKIFKHQCEFCDFKAVIRSKLITHVKVKHTKNPVFACRHCDFVTHINKRLKEHVTKIHAPLKQKPKIIIE